MKFVIKVKGEIVEYNGEVYRKIIEKEATRNITEAKAIKRKFLKLYPDNEIETKECFNGIWRVINL